MLEAKIDKNFDVLEIFTLRNILTIPPEVRDWVKLENYEGLNFAVGEDAPTTESIALQRRKLRETQKLHALLQAETARNDATISSLRALLSGQGMKKENDDETITTEPPFAFLDKKVDLTGDATFALTQLPALKSLLKDLQPRLEVLRDGGQMGEGEKSWRRERLEFIELETRRHLENVRGLELGEQGEVRDGEWQGEGRKLGKGEVEDLERVVGLVSGGDAMDEDA